MLKHEPHDSDVSSTFRYKTVHMNISFAGSGFLGIYHLGVASCLLKNGKGFMKHVHKVGGASAGALVSAVLITNPNCIKECVQFTHDLAEKVTSKPLGRIRPPGRSIMKTIEKFLETQLPMNAHELASGRLHVSVTDVETMKNKVISEFQSREHLMQTLLCSSYIPFYAGLKYPEIDGKKYCDGGYSDNLVHFDDGRTIRVSPFCGRQEISPRDKSGFGWFISTNNQNVQVNPHNVVRCIHALFPPKRKTLTTYFRKGYADAARFLKSENFYEGDPTEIVAYETTL